MGEESDNKRGEFMTHTYEQAIAARDIARETLSRYGNISLVGVTKIGEGFGLVVGFQDKLPESDWLPETINGVPYKVVISGKAVAL